MWMLSDIITISVCTCVLTMYTERSAWTIMPTISTIRRASAVLATFGWTPPVFGSGRYGSDVEARRVEPRSYEHSELLQRTITSSEESKMQRTTSNALQYLSVCLVLFTLNEIQTMRVGLIKTRSSAIAGRPWDAKACQGLLKWTWKWQPRLQWPSKYFKVIKSGTSR